MAGELSISTSAYSKIERGITDPSIGRLAEIAKILEVDVTFFFQETASKTKMEDKTEVYGFVTKDDIEEISRQIKQMKLEIASLKKELETKAPVKGKKKK